MTTAPTRLLPAFAAALALTVYGLGAAPTVLTGDSAEIQSVALAGGILHPTGYPTAIAVGWLFGRLLPGDPAHRVTLMSVVFGAAAVALVVRLLLDLGLSPPGALAGGLLFGATYTFWSAALRAEVYTLSTTLALLGLWRTVVALRRGTIGSALVAGLLLGLTVTGHLAFALPVAVMGLALAWRVGRTASPPLPALAALAGCFLAGLTPYLGLVWAHAQSYPMDYLRYIELGFFPEGPLPTYFDSAWERVWWLVSARNRLPPEPVAWLPDGLPRGLVGIALHLAVFEPGTLAAALALIGLRRQLRKRGGFGPLLVAIAVVSIAFTALLSAGQMAGLFLTPAILVVCMWGAFGLDAALGLIAARGRRGMRVALAASLLAPLVVALPAHALRVHARERGLGPLGLRAEVEPDTPIHGLVPSLRHHREPRRYGEAVLAALPESTLVIGRWSELMTLLYLRHAEHRRPDLVYHPLVYPNMMPWIAGWERTHASAGRAIAIVSGIEEIRPLAAAAESLAVGRGRWIWLLRSPLAGRGPDRPPAAKRAGRRRRQRRSPRRR